LEGEKGLFSTDRQKRFVASSGEGENKGRGEKEGREEEEQEGKG